jgi:hypothetical protein
MFHTPAAGTLYYRVTGKNTGRSGVAGELTDDPSGGLLFRLGIGVRTDDLPGLGHLAPSPLYLPQEQAENHFPIGSSNQS